MTKPIPESTQKPMKENFPQSNLFTAVICHDKPGAKIVRIRKQTLAVHLKHVEKTIDDLLVAGPIFSPDGTSVSGSILIYKTGSEEAARAMLEADPYYKAGIWQDISFQAFYGAAGSAVGGLFFK